MELTKRELYLMRSAYIAAVARWVPVERVEGKKFEDLFNDWLESESPDTRVTIREFLAIVAKEF